MADILDYTQNTTPAAGDALYLVDDASGSPADNYILLSDFADGMRDNLDREIEIILIDTNTALTTGDGFSYVPFIVGEHLNGYNLIKASAAVTTASTSGTPTFQIYNVTDTTDMLSTAITIDEGEKTSYTATAASVVDTAHDDVATGDELRFDCDVKGSSTKGAVIITKWAKP